MCIRDRVSKVGEAEFGRWPKAERMAFLINAYNAWTVELILTKYPDLKSIRDLGNLLFNSPWKKKFFTLFGRCLLYTSPSPRDRTRSRMPSSA